MNSSSIPLTPVKASFRRQSPTTSQMRTYSEYLVVTVEVVQDSGAEAFVFFGMIRSLGKILVVDTAGTYSE